MRHQARHGLEGCQPDYPGWQPNPKRARGPGRIRTCDARFRKPTLYPLSYGADVLRFGRIVPGRRALVRLSLPDSRGVSRRGAASYGDGRNRRRKPPFTRHQWQGSWLRWPQGRTAVRIPMADRGIDISVPTMAVVLYLSKSRRTSTSMSTGETWVFAFVAH